MFVVLVNMLIGPIFADDSIADGANRLPVRALYVPSLNRADKLAATVRTHR